MKNVIPDANFDSREPDYVLKSQSMVEGNFQFDPARAGAFWNGFDDLSCRVWIGRSGSRFVLKAVVRDDVHCQKAKSGQLWGADSIQFALGVPGRNGYFEFGVWQDAGGRAENGCFIAPAAFSSDKVAGQMKASVVCNGIHAVYDVEIPLSAMNLVPEDLQKGFQFNFLANDKDDDVWGRKYFMRLAPGIGSGQTVEFSPMAICR